MHYKIEEKPIHVLVKISFIVCVSDVQTQAMYQMMDEGFVGIIFSVFNEDKATKVDIFFIMLRTCNLN